jgi:hypothetical protein
MDDPKEVTIDVTPAVIRAKLEYNEDDKED